MSQWAVDEYWKHMGPEALEAAIAEKNGRRDALEAELIAAQSKGLGRRLVGAVRWLRRAPPSDEGDDVAALKEAIVRLEDEIGALQAIDEQLRPGGARGRARARGAAETPSPAASGGAERALVGVCGVRVRVVRLAR